MRDAAIDPDAGRALGMDAGAGDSDASHDGGADTGVAESDGGPPAGPPCDPATFENHCEGTTSVVCNAGHELRATCSPPNGICAGHGVCVAAVGCDAALPPCTEDGLQRIFCDGDYLTYGYCPPDTMCRPSTIPGLRSECATTITCGGHDRGDLWCDGDSVLRCDADGAHRFPCGPDRVCRTSTVLGDFATCEASDAVACNPDSFVDSCTDPSTAEICDPRAGVVRVFSCTTACCVDRPEFDGVNYCCPPPPPPPP